MPFVEAVAGSSSASSTVQTRRRSSTRLNASSMTASEQTSKSTVEVTSIRRTSQNHPLALANGTQERKSSTSKIEHHGVTYSKTSETIPAISAVSDPTAFTPVSTRNFKLKSSRVDAQLMKAEKLFNMQPSRSLLSPNNATMPKSSPKPSPKKAEKRVLPARIRRAAGGGAEGTRDLEDMVVDWLDRYGAPSLSPPDELPIVLTTLPLHLVTPATYTLYQHREATAPNSVVTVTPGDKFTEMPFVTKDRVKDVIETPDWVKVKPGQDDEEEARAEVEMGMNAHGNLAMMIRSPTKRLRKPLVNVRDEDLEDTSDAHYHALHRRYEAIERRQRKDERDKLHYEKFKMRTRIDSLRGMSIHAWTAVVNTVLSRRPETDKPDAEQTEKIWEIGRQAVKKKGVDWLRSTLVKEGEEVMRRYEELLPPEARKNKQSDSRPSTPARSAASATPPPTGNHTSVHLQSSHSASFIPARVAALRDDLKGPRRRISAPELKASAPVNTQLHTPEASSRTTITLKVRSQDRDQVTKKRKREREDTGINADSDNISLPNPIVAFGKHITQSGGNHKSPSKRPEDGHPTIPRRSSRRFTVPEIDVEDDQSQSDRVSSPITELTESNDDVRSIESIPLSRSTSVSNFPSNSVSPVKRGSRNMKKSASVEYATPQSESRPTSRIENSPVDSKTNHAESGNDRRRTLRQHPAQTDRFVPSPPVRTDDPSIKHPRTMRTRGMTDTVAKQPQPTAVTFINEPHRSLRSHPSSDTVVHRASPPEPTDQAILQQSQNTSTETPQIVKLGERLDEPQYVPPLTADEVVEMDRVEARL